ncbi:hypothetical protein LCM20_17350 [Halobacillus litoralis]|uniref:hypothetical protein n=1 Tax=Halobacillus litoralis TaxID=45668 RepID=UPI001CD27141|nr:hypothetical protein [Halobacillus litoralis]MCA0972376.1 hypothetical protein [Halobacillus litoralis]
MDLKDQLLQKGYDQVDILLVDEKSNQTTVPDITLHKVTDLEYKLYLNPDTIQYHLEEDDPYFEAEQKDEEGGTKRVKGFVLEW